MNKQEINYDQIAPGIEIHYPDFDIDSLMQTVKDSEYWYKSMVGASEENYYGKVDSDYRTCLAHDLPYNLNGREEWYRLSLMLVKHAKDYCNRNYIDFFDMEQPQMLHYRAGEGFYKRHVDHMSANPRIFSAVYYLNSVDSGGETYFPNFDISIKPVRGSLAIFPANYVYVHEARPPISNDKYVVVSWYQG